MKVVDVKILSLKTISDASLTMIEHISDGWEPEGGLLYANGLYSQVMIRREEEKSDIIEAECVEISGNREIVEYDLIRSKTHIAHSSSVERALQDGWKLYRGLIIKSDIYYQQVVKYKE